MPLPVIPDCFQAQLVWGNANAPRPASNILHFVDHVGGQTAVDLNTDIGANVTANMWTVVTLNAIINKINITELDGTTAGVAFNIVSAAKWQGQGSAEAILQGSGVISIKSAQRGPRGRNRVFLPWVGEGQQANGTFDATAQSQTATAWNTFAANMFTAGWTLGAASAAHSDFHLMTSLSMSPFVKTQRRRARR